MKIHLGILSAHIGAAAADAASVNIEYNVTQPNTSFLTGSLLGSSPSILVGNLLFHHDKPVSSVEETPATACTVIYFHPAGDGALNGSSAAAAACACSSLPSKQGDSPLE